MDVTESIIHVIKFILSFLGALGVLFLFPLAILGIVLLIIATTKTGRSKRKLKIWGIISLVTSIGLILIPMILYAILSAITMMY